MRSVGVPFVLGILLASGASGAVRLVVNPMAPLVDPDGNFSLVLGLDNPDGESVWGYSLKTDVNPVGALRIVARENLNLEVMSDPTITDANVIGRLLSDVADLGYSATVGADTRSTWVPLQKLTLHVEPVPPSPLSLTFYTLIADVDFNETQLPPVRIPEPASLLLLAAGMVSLVRRKPAA